MNILSATILSCIFASTSIECSAIGDRIVGGKPVNISDYPYQVSLSKSGFHFCGGSIISDSWVVSAAHCIGQDNHELYKIRAGSSFWDSEGEIFNVQKIIVHEQWDPYIIDYDVSLLKIMGSFFSRGGLATAIALPAPNQVFPVGTMSAVSGWGSCKHTCALGENVKQLRAVEVPIFDHDQCNFNYLGRITESMICAGYEEGGKDACQGDSGGPLAVDGVLVGVVSWGWGCAQEHFLGVYANVSFVREWIKNNSGV